MALLKLDAAQSVSVVLSPVQKPKLPVMLAAVIGAVGFTVTVPCEVQPALLVTVTV